MEMKTKDLTDENIQRVGALFQNCIVESQDDEGNIKRSIDFDLLRQELAHSIVEGTQERYQLNWPGKKEVLLRANTPIEKTLRPCREESVDFDNTQNLFIEGDNLDALKLLQATYLGKVKMIYIDPPYNTGHDFIFKDNFKVAAKQELRDNGEMDDTGRQLVSSAEPNGRFHSRWLSMMYPRLKLARNLLRDDGAIFISIDDHEVHNLRKICDEIFGIENFVCVFNWVTKKGAQGMQTKNLVVANHEYILVYAFNILSFSFLGEIRSEKGFSNPDNDSRGPWKRQHLQRLGQNLPVRTIVNPENGMKFSFETPYTQEKLDSFVAEGRVIFPPTTHKYPNRKEFLSEYQKNRQLVTALEAYPTKVTTERLYKLFEGTKIFSNPKPDTLLFYLLQVTTDKNDIIVDFFSGSATTAHAVMALNQEDNGNRRYIMVQVSEPCDEKSEAFKSGYKTIADIGKERIRRAGGKFKEEMGNSNKQQKLLEKNNDQESLDIGFRVFKVDSSNMRDIYYRPNERGQSELLDAVDNIKEDRTPEDLLFQVLLDLGVDLSLPIERIKLLGEEIFFVGDKTLAACFATGGKVTEELCREIAKRNPQGVVFRDSGFKDDSAKMNAELVFKFESPGTEIKTI